MGPVAFTIVIPLIGVVVLAFIEDDRNGETSKLVALVASVATLVSAIYLIVQYDLSVGGFQLIESYQWLPSIGSSLSLGLDGISLVLIALTSFMVPLIVLSNWHMTERVKGYMIAFLALEAAVIGVFSVTDLLAFYVFFEFTLVPMYLIIGIWGGVNRRYAAVKFFLYTLLGGLAMLVAIISLNVISGAGSFDYSTLREASLTLVQQRWLFFAFFLAFAVKVPLFPVHTWLPDAHTEAPTGGSVFLAAILLKMGGYGLIRFAIPMFPDAARELAFGTGTGFFSVPWLLILSVIGVLYGALVALVQPDIKKLVAYSSVSHMGFVVLGIFALNTTSASAGVVQMVNHGLSTGALFLLIGFLYERRHTREISAFGGLAKQTPVFAGFFLVVTMSSLALPGLNGFVGEFPILLGTFQEARWAGILAAFGAVLAALYLLWAYQRIFHGPLEGEANKATTDLTALEVGVMVPLVALILVIGVYPKPLYDLVNPAVEDMLSTTTQVQPAGDVVTEVAP